MFDNDLVAKYKVSQYFCSSYLKVVVLLNQHAFHMKKKFLIFLHCKITYMSMIIVRYKKFILVFCFVLYSIYISSILFKICVNIVEGFPK